MDRLCARPACSQHATATMAYEYARRVAWVDDLAPTRIPGTWDLCPAHADTLSVPNGWRRDDRRVSRPTLLRPSIAS